MPKIVGQIQAARDAGQDITADMYPYIAGGTALASSLPPWVADGGMEKLLVRLHDPATRAKIKAELASDHAGLGKFVLRQRRRRRRNVFPAW